MEEILASIKRVIAEDNRAAPATARSRRAPVGDEAAEPEEDVLELDDPVSESGLLSTDAAAASRDRLAALTALRQRAESIAPAPDAGPLEAVVREMLKPMLKQWLDENLPEIVEALVTREIARITGRNL